MQEKPPFSSYFDFISLTYGRGTPPPPPPIPTPAYFDFALRHAPGLFICALWSPAGKGLTFWLSFVVSNCEFVTFPLVSWVRCGT